MITKFTVIVLVVSAFAYAWMTSVNKFQKRQLKAYLVDALIALCIGFLITVPLFFLNNISGV